MRVAFDNVTHPSRVAKSLRKSLLARGVDLSLSRCQETLARMTGHADWHELAAVAASGPQPAVPDALATAGVRGARTRQYVAALTNASVPEPVAYAVLRDASPTATRLVPGPEADASFIQASHPALAGVDLSPAAIAELPGLLNLLRRTHHAVSVQPYWAERSSLMALGLVDPAAVALLGGMRRNMAHTWWGPSIMLALLKVHDANEASRSENKRGNPAVHAFLEDGKTEMSTVLASMDPGWTFEQVSALVETCGIAVLRAAFAAGRIGGVDPMAFDMGAEAFSDVYAAPWREPVPFELRPCGPTVWMRLPLDELPNWHHDCDELFERMFTTYDRFEVVAASGPDDVNLAALLERLRAPLRVALAAEARRHGNTVLILGKRFGETVKPVGAVAVSKSADVGAGVGTLSVGKPYVAGRGAADSLKLLVAAIVQAVDADRAEWEKVLVPGTPVMLTLRGSTDDVDHDFLEELRQALRNKAVVDADAGSYPVMVPVLLDDAVDVDLRGFEASPEELLLLQRLAALRTCVSHNGASVLAVQPSGLKCHILYDRGRGLARLDLPSGLADPKHASRLIKAMGERAGFDRPAILLGPLGTAFLTEAENVREILSDYPDGMRFLVPGIAEPGERERMQLLSLCSHQ